MEGARVMTRGFRDLVAKLGDKVVMEYVRNPEIYELTNDENEHVDEEEYDRINEVLYKDVKVELKDAKHGEKGKGDAEIPDACHDDVTQEKLYDQVEDDAHVTLTADHVTQKAEVDNEIVSMMNIDVRHEEPSDQTPPLLPILVTLAFASKHLQASICTLHLHIAFAG
ncbi:hypothetical protein Tco_0294651 [Tanacetum coccineum]